MAYEKDVWDLSDEELEEAFREAKANGATVQYDSAESTDDVEEFDDKSDEVLEQPDEDSDDNGSEDEGTEEVAEGSETVEGEPGEDTKTEEDKPEETEEVAEKEEQPAVDDEVLTFKANGQDYHFTVKEMKEQFGKVFGQAMDYTKKMQAIKPRRQMLDALDSAGLGNDDVNLMIDVLKGNKDALATVMKRVGVDALDLDMDAESRYVPKSYGRNETELDIRDIVDEISRDKEYAITHNILDKEWDDKSRMEFVKNPGLIRALHIDVKNGMYDKVNPIAQKMKIYDGGKHTDLEYYGMASRQYEQNLAQYESQVAERAKAEADRKANEARRLEEVRAKEAKAAADREAASKRKAAAPTKKASTSSKGVNYLDSDEAFDEWYAENVSNKQ